MSTVKISELPIITHLNTDTTQTLLPAVDLVTGVTGKMTTKVLAQTLYSNDVLNVGNNEIIFPGVVAQFVGENPTYLQLNVQNLSNTGSGDLVVTSDDGTDTSYFIDVGIQGSNAPLGALQPHDGYLLVQGDNANTTGNLIVGTVSSAPGLQLKFVSGGYEESNVYAVFESTQAHFLNDLVVDGDITGPTITAIDTYAISAHNTANVSFSSSNLVASYANSAYTKANNSGSYANGAFAKANTNAESISTINLTLLNTQNYANGAFAKANNAGDFANGAFAKANNALANTTGTFEGSLTINGKANVNQQLLVANSSYDYTNTALVRIVGSTGAMVQPPANPGYMLSITGVDGIASRVVNSSYGTGTYALFAGRKANGTASTPTAVANNDVIARWSGSGYNGSSFTATGQARIDFVADQDFTTANNGSRIEFYNTISNSNTVTKIASFNAMHASFLGTLNPQKGFVLTPNVQGTLTTSRTIDFANDSLLKLDINDNFTFNLTGYTTGKIVEVWVTNSAGQNKTITHGCLANNSTKQSTSFTILSNSCALLKYFSIDGDQANVYVSITNA